MDPNCTDLDLLARFREEGDRDALSLLFERHRALAYRVALGVLRSPADAEDAAQDAFLRLLAYVDRTQVRDSLAGLVARVALHSAQDLAKSARRRRTREMVEAVPDCCAADEPCDSLAARETQRVLRRAVDALDERYRLPVLLYYWEGLSTRETAESLGISQTAVTTRLSRAMAKLREHLKRDGTVLALPALIALLKPDTAQAAPAGLAASLDALAASVAVPEGAGAPFTTSAAGSPPPALAAVAGGSLAAKLAGAVLVVAVSAGAWVLGGRPASSPDARAAGLALRTTAATVPNAANGCEIRCSGPAAGRPSDGEGLLRPGGRLANGPGATGLISVGPSPAAQGRASGQGRPSGTRLAAAEPEGRNDEGANTIRGTVVDETGAPVPGAEMAVSWNDMPGIPPGSYGRYAAHDSRELRADGAGRFAVPRRNAAIATVWAMAPAGTVGHVSVVAPWVPVSNPEPVERGTRPITLRLEGTTSVSGTVLAPDGRPAVGVTVAASVPEAWLGRFSAQTDKAGRYRLNSVPLGARLLASDPRFLDEAVPVEDGIGDATMRPGCRIRGRMLDGEKGLAGWPILAGSQYASLPLPQTVTGPDGAFFLSGLKPDSYWLLPVIVDEGRTVPAVQVSVTAAQPDAEATLRAVEGGIVAVRVVESATGQPVPGLGLRVCSEHRPVAVDWQYARCGPDGASRVRVPAGEVWVGLTYGASYSLDMEKEFLQAFKEGRQGRGPAGSLAVMVKDGEETPLELRVRPLVKIKGRVLDREGKPVPGVSVRLSYNQFGWSVTAGDDGTFELNGDYQRELTLTARRGDIGLGVPMILRPPFPKSIVLQMVTLPQAVLTGRVVDEKGEPLAGMPVRLCEAQLMRDQTTYELVDSGVTGRDGRYRLVLRELLADHVVRVPAEQCRSWRGGRVLPGDTADRQAEDLVLNPEPAVTGRVVDAAGLPVAGAEVTCPDAPQCRAQTSADGWFRLCSIPEGRVRLAASLGKRTGEGGASLGGPEVTLTLGD